MILQRQVTLTIPEGLHIRIAAKLVEEARKFQSEISISNDESEVTGKDIMALLTLGATQGTLLTIKAQGDDAEEAVIHLEKLFLDEFR
ncbi:MAG: HPr family phosphocarrier protein [Planctomycetota bacterium]|nr:HPr family phosphocarrier protein [Planctomycetota bacterium]MDA1137622.1 HPr family phosphocarrier protein [Planctomycetota bacterium]